MSKILLINGSPHEHGCTDTALNEIAVTLSNCGVESEIVWIGRQPVAGCIACGTCWYPCASFLGAKGWMGL